MMATTSSARRNALKHAAGQGQERHRGEGSTSLPIEKGLGLKRKIDLQIPINATTRDIVVVPVSSETLLQQPLSQ
ncbi:ABC transporter ATP-binding protein [Sesbania bispinosa]|nr:ABC transporter ATP-binding protein [Sesbania bispinosa]